jgi:DNA-binding beta-propeller fold protein YncE
VVTRSKDRLHKGDVLVSNFNNKANTQGTGTTIVEVAPNHRVRVFAQINAARLPGACPGGIGLTTALAVLGNDWVVVGSLPTVAGNPATAKAGCLLVLNSEGRVVETFDGHGINGPWDMTAVSKRGISALFVTNVLNGTVAADGKVVHRGTVLRLMVTTPAVGLPRLIAATTIGSALLRQQSAGTGHTVSRNGAIHGPLGLTIAPGGDILTVNSLNGNLVEITPDGRQVAVKTLDRSGSPAGAGALFGLAVAPYGNGVYFVDDATNTLDLLH